MKVRGKFDLLGVGGSFIALDMPAEESVMKFTRPLRPLNVRKRELRKWWSAYCRRAKQVKKAATADQIFRMLLQSKSIDIDKCFPPTDILDDVDVSFEWEGRSNRYQGTAYLQRRVEFFGTATPLDSFNWDAIIEIQQYLWRAGIGLGSVRETWGPKNWGRMKNGEIRLADISSLNQDKNRVSTLLDSPKIQIIRWQMEEYQPLRCQGQIDSYFTYIGKHLNQESLNRLWKAGF